jgi:bacterial/archaeal transporter family protein
MKDIPMLLLAVVLQVLGNVSLSHGMRQVGELTTVTLETLLSFGVRSALNPWVGFGIGCLAGFFGLFLVALSRLDLSYVQPILASSYVLTALFAWVILKEPLSITRWAGTLAVTAGIAVVGVDEHQKSKRRSRKGKSNC